MMRTVLLGDVIELAYGKSLPQRSRVSGRFPVFGSNGRVDTHNKSLVGGPGIIVGRKGSVGEVIWSKQDFWPIDTTYYVKLKNPDDDLRYWYYVLKTLGLNKLNSHSAIPGLNRDVAYIKQVPLRSTLEQEKIANILGSLDEKIELNRRMNETLEQLGQALFRHYFVDKAKQSNGNIQTIPLGKKFHPKRGRSLQARDMICGDTPVISGGLKPAGFHNEANTTTPVITISASGANAGFVSVWGESVWSADSSYIDSTTTEYVYTYYLFLKNKQKEIYDMQTGSGQPHIYPKHIELLEIANLPDCDFNDFEQRVRPLFDMIHKNKKQIDYLSNIRDLLLPKLISGEIEI
jgi:putative type I site-specific deoxyribonuclease